MGAGDELMVVVGELGAGSDALTYSSAGEEGTSSVLSAGACSAGIVELEVSGTSEEGVVLSAVVVVVVIDSEPDSEPEGMSVDCAASDELVLVDVDSVDVDDWGVNDSVDVKDSEDVDGATSIARTVELGAIEVETPP